MSNNNSSTTPTQSRPRGPVRAWANLSLRVKLILVLLAVALLSVGTIAFLNVRSTSAALTAQANENMTAMAVSEARNIGTLLAKRVNAMQAFALHEHAQEGVAAQNGDYSGGTEAILSELAKLDEQWVAASDDDALVRERLSNELAHELKNVTTIVPDFAEAFLTDRYGGLVAASDRTSDYYQADEEWWQAAYNDGNGAVFIALPELDESTGVIGIDMAVPVYDQSNEIIGIMRTTLNVTALIDRLAEVELGETGEAHLLLEGEVFVGPGGEPESFDDSAALTQLETAPQGAMETSYDGRPSLVGYAIISSPTGEQFISDLGWKVFIHQDQEEALSAVALQTRATGLLALLIAGIAAVAAVVMGQVLAAPIANLTNAVTRFTAGDMDARAKSKSSDEIGTLATNFNQMAERVGGLLTDIQRRSAELEERTRELEASQRVTFAASERTTPDELLGLVVDLVRDQFDLYHAQVYLVDEERQAAVLRQSTGYAGSQLLQKGHQIPLDAAALVTRAIHTGEPVLVADVNQAKDWLPNPLLPETQSELAVPLKVGDRVIGVLDAQDMTSGRFTESTVALFRTMADQIAFLFENNELLERVTEQTETLTVFTTQLRTAAEIARQSGAVLDPESLLQQVVELMQSRFGLYHAHIYVLESSPPVGGTEGGQQLVIRAGSGEVGRALREEGHAIPLDREHSLVARAARDQEAVLVADTALESDFMPNPLLPQTRAELAVPLVAGGRVLGVLDMQDDQVERFTETDLDTFSTLAGQIATALQNASLFEQTEALYGISSDLNTASNEDEMLQALARPAVEAGCFQATLMYIDLDDAGEPEWMEVAALWQREGTPAFPVGARFYLPEFALARLWMASPDEPQLIADLTTDERVDENLRNVMAQIGSRALSSIPLTHAGRWVGILNFIWTEPHEFSAQEKEMYNTFVGLAAPAVASRQLLLNIEASLQETQVRFEVSQTLAGARTEENVLDAIIQQAGLYPQAQVSIMTFDYEAEERFSVVRRAEAFDSGLVAPFDVGMRFPVAQFPLAQHFSADRPFVSANTLTDERFDPASRERSKRSGAISLAVLPITAGDEWIGLFIVESKQEGFFDERKLHLYQTLAEQGAMALRIARLRDQTTRSEERFRDVALSTSDWVWEVDAQGRYTYCSERVVDVLGYTAEEMLGKTPFDVMPEEEAARVGEIFGEIVANKQPIVDLENWNITKDGREVYLLTNGTPILDEESNLAGYRGVDKDITERKRAEESLRENQQLLEGFIDNAAAVAYVKDTDGRYMLVNRQYETLFNVTKEGVVGKTDHDVFPRELADAFQEADLQVLDAGAPMEDGGSGSARGWAAHLYVNQVPPL